jgi:hypothetical protein
VNSSQEYIDMLDKSKDFQEIFSLVKKVVKKIINEARVGLMLVLASLPEKIGAYHEVGSNAIVLNRRLLDAVIKSGKTFREINSYIFTILLHEYLHSLGHLDENQVKKISYKVTSDTFGENHPTTKFVVNGLVDNQVSKFINKNNGEMPQIIPDLENTSQSYIH